MVGREANAIVLDSETSDWSGCSTWHCGLNSNSSCSLRSILTVSRPGRHLLRTEHRSPGSPLTTVSCKEVRSDSSGASCSHTSSQRGCQRHDVLHPLGDSTLASWTDSPSRRTGSSALAPLTIPKRHATADKLAVDGGPCRTPSPHQPAGGTCRRREPSTILSTSSGDVR